MEPRDNPITPAGLAALRARYDHLLSVERPEITAIVSWAAGNGDRSENGDKARVWFGATVTIADEDDNRRTLTLVGDDEQDASQDRIGWSAPIARALRGAAVGDLRTVRLPAGEKEWEVVAVEYPGN